MPVNLPGVKLITNSGALGLSTGSFLLVLIVAGWFLYRSTGSDEEGPGR